MTKRRWRKHECLTCRGAGCLHANGETCSDCKGLGEVMLKTKPIEMKPLLVCHECGGKRLRLEVPPDFEAFEVCRDCGSIQKGSVD